MGIKVTKPEIGFGTDDEEGLAEMQETEPGKIQISPVQDIKTSRFRDEFIKDIDVMDLAVYDLDEGGDGTAQIKQSMQFKGSFMFPEDGPGEKRKTEVDRRGIECLDCLFQLDAKVVIRIQASGNTDRVYSASNEDTTRYPEGFPGRSVGQRPCKETDPDR